MRKLFVVGLMLLGAVVMGGCNSSDDDVEDVAGLWKMTANSTSVYTFDLSLTQSGESLTGFMDATNAGDPTDSISGSISSNGTITFTRTRVGHWTQVYTGKVNSSTSMDGTFTHTPGTGGPWPWSAVR